MHFTLPMSYGRPTLVALRRHEMLDGGKRALSILMVVVYSPGY